MSTPPSDPIAASGPQDIADVLKQRLGKLMNWFGVGSIGVSLLVGSGFLSEYAAYQAIGLPRISFNVLAAAETGLNVWVDSFTWLFSSPWRATSLLLGMLLLLALWVYRDHPRLSRWIANPKAHFVARLLCVLYALLLVSGQLQFIQHGLDPNHFRQDAPHGLSLAYHAAGEHRLPSPREQQREIERLSYQLPVFPLPHWAEYWLDGVSRRDLPVQEFIGIPVRVLPESRQAAAHVYGWLMLCLLPILLALPLLVHWQQWRDADPLWSVPWPPQRRASGWTPLPHPLLDEAGQYLLTPLLALLCLLGIALLPLCHGLLLRSSVGHETVLVVLQDPPPKTPPPAHAASAPTSDKPLAVGCNNAAIYSRINEAENAYREALRDYIQLRPGTEREESRQARHAWLDELHRLTDQVIDANCIWLAPRLLMQSPGLGLMDQNIDMVNAFATASDRVLRHYRVHYGVLLTYPRGGEPMLLAHSWTFRTQRQNWRWQLTPIDPRQVHTIQVLPRPQSAQHEQQLVMLQSMHNLTQSADNTDALKFILRSQDAAALEATLTLLDGRFLHTSHAGVAVTALGGQAQANALERPDLSIRAIDTLIDLASAQPSAAWPNKSLRIRGAAATALHLSRSPYAAYRLAERLHAESGPNYACTGSQPGVGCLPQTYTSAGFLLSDLTAESREFSRVSIAIPAALDRSRDNLLNYLLDAASRTDLSNDIRSAACTGLRMSGVQQVEQKQADAFLASLKRMDASREGIALGSCLNSISMMKMDYPTHREFLRALFLRDDLGDLTPRLHRIALVTLSELGLEQESAWLAHAYQQVLDGSDEKEVLENHLDEAEQESLGKALLSCVSEQRSQNPARARRCLEGMRHMKEHYDGDSGAAAQLIAWLRAGDTPALKTEFCQVLAKFKARKGNEAKLWWGKHGQQQCGNSHAQEPRSEAAALRALLERLGGSR